MLKKISYSALLISILLFAITMDIIKVPIVSNNLEFFQTIGLISTSTYVVTLIIRIIKALLFPIILVLVLVMFTQFSSALEGMEIMNKLRLILSQLRLT